MAKPEGASAPGFQTDDQFEFACCMAWDAFRVAIGHKPKTFSGSEILRWLEIMLRESGDG